jgi:hypothetical protein
MWAVKLSTVLMALPHFSGPSICDMVAEECLGCTSYPEGTTVLGVGTGHKVHSPHNELKLGCDHE